jgi:hypothetical protein
MNYKMNKKINTFKLIKIYIILVRDKKVSIKKISIYILEFIKEHCFGLIF